MKTINLIYCLLLVGFVSTGLLAQSPTEVAGASDRLVEPFQIVGNIYFVGPEAAHSSFLITSPEGHILINSGFERQVPTIRESIEKLGFDFSDIRIVLGSHAHRDHQEGDAQVKLLSGAQVMAMAEDVPWLEELRPDDKPHPIDRVLHDKDTVQLGGVTLTALLTAGHTPGCTTYTTEVEDEGRTYDVVIGCGWGAAGRDMSEYPNKVNDYRRSYQVAKTLSADVFLGSHGHHWGLLDKLSRRGQGSNPFIDVTTLPDHVVEYEKQFQEELAKQGVGAQ